MNTPSLIANPLVKLGMILAYKRQLYFLAQEDKKRYSITKRFEFPGYVHFALLKRNEEDLIAIANQQDKVFKFFELSSYMENGDEAKCLGL